MGDDSGTYKFSIKGTDSLLFDGTNLTIDGTINAGGGSLGN